MLLPISVRYFNIKMSEVFHCCLKNSTNKKRKASVFLMVVIDLVETRLLGQGLFSCSFRKASKGHR